MINFQRYEFKCNCGMCDCDTVDFELITVLSDLRDYFNSPVTINSGHRCSEYNRKVGGSPGSKHLDGRAADIVVHNVPSYEVYAYLDNKYPGLYGLGSYESFTHIDTRNSKARW